MDIAKLTAASVPFLGADGKEYRLAPMTLVDFGELHNWAKMIPVKEMQDDPEIMASEPDLKELLFKEAYAKGQNHSVQDTQMILANTLRGARRFFWQSVKREHPDIEQAQVNKAITADNMESFGTVCRVLNSPKTKRQEAIDEARRLNGEPDPTPAPL